MFSFLIRTLLKLFYFTKIQQSCVTVKRYFINFTLTPENALLQIYLDWRCVSSDHVLPLSESAVICRVFVALVPASSPRRARACYTIQSDSAISANHCNATQRLSKKRKGATSCGLDTYPYFLVGIKSAFTRLCCLSVRLSAARNAENRISVWPRWRTRFLVASFGAASVFRIWLHMRLMVILRRCAARAVCSWVWIVNSFLQETFKLKKKMVTRKMALFSPSPSSSVWFSRKFGVTRTTHLRRLRGATIFFLSPLNAKHFHSAPAEPESKYTKQSNVQSYQINKCDKN